VTPITVIAATSYDFQHNDDGTRQIAWLGGGNHVHFAITYWDVIPESLDQVDRYVHYNAWNSSAGGSLTLGAEGDNVLACVGGSVVSMRGGFATLDVATGDLGTPSCHALSEPEQPAGSFSSWIIDQGFPGLAVWNCVEVPGTVNQESIWPHMSIDVGGSATKAPGDDVYHVTAHPSEANDRIYYWRRIGVAGAWVGPVCLDETSALSYHPAPDLMSQKVSLAYVRHQDNPDGLLDVIYITSANSGQDWINADIANPGSCVGPVVNGGRTNITNYWDPAGPQAWMECTSEYDFQGRYHVIWVEQVFANRTADSRIKHWDNVAMTTRTLAQAIDFGNVGGDGGRDLWLAYPQMGFGDGTTLCTDGPANAGPAGATTNNHYVYVTYEQYGGETAVETNDVSVTPQQNLEVYLAVSNDHGNTWSPSVNLTNTKTPGCDGTFGNECKSERDPSIAKLVNDTIMVMYIEDQDAGDAVLGQGTWTYNPVQFLRIPGGTDVEPVCPQIAANFAARLSNQDPDCEYNAPRGGSQIESLTIENLGNAALTGNVSKVGGAAWLVMTTGAYTVNAGAAANVRTVTMSAAAPPQSTTEGLYQETIRMTHNDPNKVSPRDIAVDFFVFDEFYCPEFLTLNTGWLWLTVGSVGRIVAGGGEEVWGADPVNDGPAGMGTAGIRQLGGLARLRPGVGDTSWSIYDGSLLIGIPAALPDTLVFRNIYGEGRGQPGIRALGSLVVDTAAYGSGAGAATAFARQATTDSLIGIDVRYIFPQHSDSANFILVEYKLYNRTGSAINDLIVGQGVDFDITPGTDQGTVQPGSQNTGHLVTNYNMIYQQGVDTLNHNIVGDNTATRFKGGMSVVSATAAPRGWIAPNDPWLSARPGGGFSDGYLYDEMTKSGFELFPPGNPDPEEDLHSVAVFDQNTDLSPTGSKWYVLALVSSDVGNGDETDLINSAKKAWKYCFGWAEIVTHDTLPNNTSATYNYHAVGSHENGLGGGCTGCVFTEVSDPSGRFTRSGACDGTISFNGAGAVDQVFTATYRVATPCGGYQESAVIMITVGSPVPCDCPFQADLDSDGDSDACDLAFVIDFVFFGPDIQDPNCPVYRADFNADGFADATDLAFMVDYVFFNGPPPVDPCAAPNLPCETKAPGTRRAASHIAAPVRGHDGSPASLRALKLGTGSSVDQGEKGDREGAETHDDQRAPQADHVLVQSTSVAAGGTVSIGVFVENSATVRGVVIPLIVRELSAGAFIRSLSLTNPMPGSRMEGRLSDIVVSNTYPMNDGWNSDCQQGFATIGSPDFASPDGILLAGMSMFYNRLLAGSDLTTGIPSMSLTVEAAPIPGEFEIDTTCTTPGNHLTFVSPNDECYAPTFTKGVITIEPSGEFFDCAASSSDPYFIACPKGDIPFKVRLRSNLGNPWPGENVWLDFSSCPGGQLIPQPGQYPSWPIVPGAAVSDDSGVVQFAIAAGGDCAMCQVGVYADCGLIDMIPVRSTDADGNMAVTTADYADERGMCRDLNASGAVGNNDYDIHFDHLLHGVAANACDRLSQVITTDPESFLPGDNVKVRWTVTNHNPSNSCSILLTNLYHGAPSPNPTWTFLETFSPNVTLAPGQSYTDSVVGFQVPALGRIALRSLMASGCCTGTQEEIVVKSVDRVCPPRAVCFEFPILNVPPGAGVTASPALPEGMGWTYTLEAQTDPPNSYLLTICTSDITPLGVGGGVTVVIDGAAAPLGFQVIHAWNNGDLCGGVPSGVDCFVNAVDLACLIDYVFFGAPPFDPEELADLNCDTFGDAVDLAILIDFVFFGGPQPLDCGIFPSPPLPGGGQREYRGSMD